MRSRIQEIDNSTSLNVDQASLVSKLLPCKEDLSDINSISTVLFEFGESKDLDLSTELQIANLIFAFLLFEAHAYVVSSASTNGQMIGIQDGFIYFFLSSGTNDDATSLIESFEREQLVSPIWLLDILAEREERAEKQGQE